MKARRDAGVAAGRAAVAVEQPAPQWERIREGGKVIKSEELSNPASCMNRALPDEMTFVLLARDAAAPDPQAENRRCAGVYIPGSGAACLALRKMDAPRPARIR